MVNPKVEQIKQLEEKVALRKRLKKSVKKVCSGDNLKRRFPILQWLPKYSFLFLIQDIIAGVTVGLTAIPQGIAYAIIAGVPAEYGLYASLTAGFVYTVFGSSKDVTVGPTAIVSTLVAKYVTVSTDVAVLAAFLTGIMIFLMGFFQLGFLVNFISVPVIKGFTTAAAFQIAASQLKGFFGFDGISGQFFAESIVSFIKNIKTCKLWDPILGSVTVVMLITLKRLGSGCTRTDGFGKQIRWFVSLGRNAVVVIFGIIVAYILKLITGGEPLTLIGDIGHGLPPFTLPPFSTVVGNETLVFTDMLQILGPQAIILPLVAILESIAIAKAFAEGGRIDATQEMLAVGICNIFGSFTRSIPITGSFTRTALNNASGVQTPAGGIFTALLIFVALSMLTSTFYFIPKASLAALIITAMYSMVEYEVIVNLWKNSKKEFLLMMLTILVCSFVGIEYGIIVGTVAHGLLLLYTTSKPSVEIYSVKSDNGDLITVSLYDKISYCAAESVRKAIMKASSGVNIGKTIVIDGDHLVNIDSTVATNLMTVLKVFEKSSQKILFLNFKAELKSMCVDLYPKAEDKFVYFSSMSDLIDSIPKDV